MIITANGVIIRLQVKDISTMSRVTQGVTLIRVREGEEVSTVARVNIDDEELDNLNEEDEVEIQEEDIEPTE